MTETHIAMGHQGPITSLAMSPDETLLASLSRDRCIKIWEVDQCQLRVTVTAGEVGNIVFCGQDFLASPGPECFQMFRSADGALVERHLAAAGNPFGRFPNRSILIGTRFGVISYDPETKQIIAERQVANLREAWVIDDGAAFLATSEGLWRWDTDAGSLALVIPWPERAIAAMALSVTSGSLVAVHGNELSVYNLVAGGQPQSIMLDNIEPNINGVLCAAISKDGRFIALGLSPGMLIIFHDGAVVSRLTIGADDYSGVSALTFLANGEAIACGSHDGHISIVEWHKNTCHNFAVPPVALTSVACSPDGTLIAAGTAAGHIQVWDARTGKLHCCFQAHSHTISDLAISHREGGLVGAAASDGRIGVWDWRRPENPLLSWKSAGGSNSSIALSPDAQFIAGTAPESDGGILVRNMRTTTVVILPLMGIGKLGSIRFSLDGKRVACSRGELLCVWEIERMTLLLAQKPLLALPPMDLLLASGSVQFRAFSPRDPRLIAISVGNDLIRLWNTVDQTLEPYFRASGNGVQSVAFAPDGKQIAVGYMHEDVFPVRVWSTAEGKITSRLPGHGSGAGVSFTPDGGILVSSSWDGAIRIWEPGTGVLRATMLMLARQTEGDALHWISFTPDGFYTGSPGIELYLRLPAAKLRSGERPDKVCHALSGVASSSEG